MIKQKAFYYIYQDNPGIGVLAENQQDGWRRINFYAFGVNIDEMQKNLTHYIETDARAREKISVPAQSKSVLAGGMVFKGITCLMEEGSEFQESLSHLERELENFRTIDPGILKRVEQFDPMRNYWFMYKGIVPGLTKVMFFEYATQMAFMGLAREKDLPMVEEFYLDLESLKDYITIPKPLRTDEYDPRADVYLFMIRNPLKEELQGEYVQKLTNINDLELYTM